MLKKTFCTLLFALGLVCICAAKGKANETKAGGADADTSYAFGVALGSDLKQTGLSFNYEALVQGIKDSVEGKETKFTLEEAIGKIQAAYAAEMTRQAEQNKQKEGQFLAENGKKSGVSATASGLQYEVLRQGTGPKPGPADRVQVNYEGTLTDGTVFDSSSAPVEFALNEVIPGWAEGIQLMPEGSSFRLFIPSSLAYGEQGAPGFIPPNSTLIFKVDLLAIVK